MQHDLRRLKYFTVQVRVDEKLLEELRGHLDLSPGQEPDDRDAVATAITGLGIIVEEIERN